MAIMGNPRVTATAAAALLTAGIFGCAAGSAFAAESTANDLAGTTASTAVSAQPDKTAATDAGSSGTASGSSSSSGSTSSTTKSEEPETKSVTEYLLNDAVLYKENSAKSQQLATIAVGSKVSVLKPGKKWSQVEYDGKTGYVKKSLLTTSKTEAQQAKKTIIAERKAAAKRAAKKRWEKPSTAKKAGKWYYKSKRKYQFRYKDGTYPTGITKINGTIYYFKDQKGHLSRSSKARRVVTVGSKRYYVNGSSEVQKGWEVIGSSLYDFAGKYRAALQNKTRKGITLSSNGKAVMNLEASVKKKCIVMLRSITDRHAAKYVQLQAAWNHLVSHQYFYYVGIDINPYDKTWAKRYANQMLTTHGGDCYGFSATFAALAYEIGYKNVRIVTGSVTNGNLHCAVKINGLWYDPEEQWNGYIYGIFGLSGNPSNFASYSTNRLYRSYDGSGADRGVTSAYRAATSGNTVVRKGNRYYGYQGSKAALTGAYVINGKLYKFNKSHYLTVAAYKKLNRAAQQNKPWANLRKLLGKPSNSSQSASCYGSVNGKDIAYKYKHITVSCFKPDNGGTVIIESVTAR